jgi:CRP-like cAMP-binding protein
MSKVGAIAPCSNCAAYELNLCTAVRKKEDSETALVTSSGHFGRARRIVIGPKEWSEFVHIMCSGWALSAITLPDGRRQILSFLLSGDISSTASLFEPFPGRLIEAVTDVEYRTFKRSEIKAVIFKHPDLLEKLSKTWIDERAAADQLAADLGRRTADERIARLILNLTKRLTKRGMTRNSIIEFPLRQRQIADATGLTPVHVSKVLSKFQRAELIRIDSRSLTILDMVRLRDVSEGR